MKKIKFVAIPLVAALCLGGAACKQNVDEAPEITGVTDKMCAVGEVYDLLDGIAALDKEDGDITPSMEITIDGEKVDGYYTQFEEEGDFEVVYKVTDSMGHVTQETATVSTVARDVYKKFDLVDFSGFEVKTAGSAKLGSQSVIGDGANSKYTFKVTGAAAAEDAILTRTFGLKSGKEYTIKYYLKSSAAGTAKLKIAGGEATDVAITEGDNEITFNYSVPAGEEDKTDVKIELLLGGLGADLEVVFDKVVTAYEADAQQPDNGSNDKVVEFTNETVDPRIDNDGGKSTLEGSVEVAEDNKSATLKITTVCSYGDRWRGGMFIKTGVALEAGKTYNISFNTEAAEEKPYEVCILRSQWGPDEFIEAIESPANGKVEKAVTITEATAGELWLYVRSGDQVNEITISDLKVTLPVASAAEKFKFTNETVDPRIDNDGGKSTLEGSVEIAEDNSSATLKITTVCSYGDRWRGGMFIKTGTALEAGKTYNISFTTEAAEEKPYEVCILRSQWGPDEFIEAIENPANGKVEKTITITEETAGELWLYVRSGDQVNEITISDLKVSTPDAEKFEFTSETVDPRIDNDGGNSALEGSVEVAEDKSSATLKITTACSYGDRWRGGMFIKTGAALEAGKTYNISFTIAAAEEKPYDVCILRNQWGPDEFIETIESPANGKVEKTITITEATAGELWLYVRSGDQVNEITISGLKCEAQQNDDAEPQKKMVTETFTCENLFKMFAKEGAPNYVQWVDGKLIFEVEKFSDTDWHNKIEGPQFESTISGVEFMISFKAKATSPVLVTWVGPKSGGWDPNLIWQQFNLSDTEKVYTFKGNESDVSMHQFEWQFGFSANKKYENVKIEISDIVIYWQSGILDE